MADGSGAIPAALPMGAPAGNPNGAQQFGAALSQAQAQANAAPPPPPPPAQGQPEIRGNFLPYVKNPQTGQVQWGVPQVVQGVVDAVTLPGDALAGKVDPNSPEGVARALNFALTVTGGSAAAPKPSGVLTMGIGNKTVSFEMRQLDRKFKHAVDFGIDTTRKNPTTLKQFEGAVAGHLADEATYAHGTYIPVQGSEVYFNPMTNNVVVLDQAGNFVTGWKLAPGTPQFDNYLNNGVLR